MDTGDQKPLYFGWFAWHPPALQRLNKAWFVLIFMCLANNFQSMSINGLVGVVVSSIERRFGLTSLQSSWIVSSYDVSTVPVLLLIAYFGNKVHRPKLTAIGLLVLAVGLVFFFLPHFVSSVYRPVNRLEANNLCRNRTGEDVCEGVDRWVEENRLYPLFIVGRILSGVGATPLYTILVTFMDDQVTKETFSMYIALHYAAGVFGPALGFIIGGYLLNVYTDFHSINAEKELGLSPDDPRWVGAWWLGFLICAVALLFCALPLSCFPRDLPGSSDIRANKQTEAYKSTPEDEDNSGDISKVTFKELPKLLKGLFTNPTYISLTLFLAMDAALINGFTAFGPKYVENQYSVAAATAGMAFGLITIPGGAGGTILGGVIIRRFKLKIRGIMRAEILCTVFIILMCFALFILCSPVRFAGVTTEYNSTLRVDDMQKNLTAGCNAQCDCANVPYDPICSAQNVRYYSPCHAGCTNMTGLARKEYFNCSCVSNPEPSKPDGSSDVCSVESCNDVNNNQAIFQALPGFLVMLFFAMLCIFICSSLNISATVRCVPGPQRAMGIALQWIGLRLLGSVPGPVIFGRAFDGACALWEERCGSRGACQFYNHFNMSLYLWIVVFAVKFASLVFLLIAYCAYKPPVESVIKLEENKNGEINNGYVNTDVATASSVTHGTHVDGEFTKL